MTQFESYKLTDADAERIHTVIADHLQSLKNWMVSAVERGDIERAKALAADVRHYADLYATFNVKARREIAAARAA